MPTNPASNADTSGALLNRKAFVGKKISLPTAPENLGGCGFPKFVQRTAANPKLVGLHRKSAGSSRTRVRRRQKDT
jgi:hypothetical protein